MQPYRDFSKNTIEYYENNNPEKIEASDTGSKYITKTAFKFVKAFENMADCILAAEEYYGPAENDDQELEDSFGAAPAADADTSASSSASFDLQQLLPLMLNGLWADGEFKNLEATITSLGTSLSDNAAREIIFSFMHDKIRKEKLDEEQVTEKFSEQYGDIDADEWAAAESF